MKLRMIKKRKQTIRITQTNKTLTIQIMSQTKSKTIKTVETQKIPMINLQIKTQIRIKHKTLTIAQTRKKTTQKKKLIPIKKRPLKTAMAQIIVMELT